MRKRSALCVTMLMLGLGLVNLALANGITFTCTSIDVPDAVFTAAGGINNSGQIVGGYVLLDGTRHGFLDSGGGFTAIDDPDATSGSLAAGINNLDRIVGFFDLPVPLSKLEGAHGFFWDSGVFTTSDFPGASITSPAKINDSGQIVGVYRLTDGIAHGFTGTLGSLATLDFPTAFSTHDNGVNDVGKIVGQYRASDGAPRQGFLYSEGVFGTIDFPHAAETRATDIDNSGDIVGFYNTTTVAPPLGFLYKGGNFFTIDCSNVHAAATQPFGINDKGNIVGLYFDAIGGVHGFETSFPAITQVFVDIKPTSCPNPLNTWASGVLPVAILGTATFDVTTVDPSSVRLMGVSPLRSALEDVATPFTGPLVDANSCATAGPDGFTDLILYFSNAAVSAALGPISDGQVLVLTLTGNLLPQFGGTPITGQDVVITKSK